MGEAFYEIFEIFTEDGGAFNQRKLDIMYMIEFDLKDIR